MYRVSVSSSAEQSLGTWSLHRLHPPGLSCLYLFVPVILAPSRHQPAQAPIVTTGSSVQAGAAKPSQGWCLIVIVKYLDASARNKQASIPLSPFIIVIITLI